ncbi:hypothetical protein [Hyphomicrobium sp.]|uniref:hypothetical protein n=1 Tax=Hyphomicrobium sp. TaxID=82 RepID=UPI003F6F78CD
MPRSANERDLTPLMIPSAVPAAGKGRARGIMKLVAAYSGAERRRAGSLAGMLDGIGGLGWSVAGFVVGAVFWHFIGFWSFVADVVLAGGPAAGIDKAARGQPQQQLVRMADAETVASTVVAAACTSLVLDRRTGITSAGACHAGHASLPMDAMEGREDRLRGTGR